MRKPVNLSSATPMTGQERLAKVVKPVFAAARQVAAGADCKRIAQSSEGRRPLSQSQNAGSTPVAPAGMETDPEVYGSGGDRSLFLAEKWIKGHAWQVFDNVDVFGWIATGTQCPHGLAQIGDIDVFIKNSQIGGTIFAAPNPIKDNGQVLGVVAEGDFAGDQ